jgi:transposase-like protein
MMERLTDTSGERERRAVSDTAMSLPTWFRTAFAHVTRDVYRELARIWSEEPALQEMVAMLSALQPEHQATLACPYCDNRNVRLTKSDLAFYHCDACDSDFARSKNTPFYRLQRQSYPRLYATAVLLWAPWTPVDAWQISGARDAGLFRRYRKRLGTLFSEALEQCRAAGTLPVSRPRFRLGFSPADQGLQCLRCGSPNLIYFHRTDADNPGIQCAACGYQTYLLASRRHLLPVLRNVACPRCAGRNIAKINEARVQRAFYRCRECRRQWYPGC